MVNSAFYDFCGFWSVAVNNVYKLQFITYIIFMAAVRSRCGHYIFALWFLFSLWPPYGIGQVVIFTGSIARSANLPVFSLLRGRFWGFSPRRGDKLHWWGWNLAQRRGPAKFHPHLKFGTEEGTCQISPPPVQRQGCRTPKIEIFTQIWSKFGI